MKFEIGDKVIGINEWERDSVEDFLFSFDHQNEIRDRIGIVIGRQEHEPRSQNLYKIHFMDEDMYKFRNRWIIEERDLDFLTPEKEEKYYLKFEEEKKLKEEIRLGHLDIDPFGEENW